jgi:hypothetical protein
MPEFIRTYEEKKLTCVFFSRFELEQGNSFAPA